MPRTLSGQGHPLSVVSEQLQVLHPAGRFRPFEETLRARNLAPLKATGLQVFQMNLGKMCNQTCKHCHVDAGPDRKEIMSRETMEACLLALSKTEIPTVDLTGGAPELNPDFRWLVERLSEQGRRVIDRCNLTILLANGFTDLPDFFAEHRLEVIASLPYYLPRNTDAQRGGGVFEASIEAIKRLNAVGYAQPGTGLELNLVYNPTGAFLPPRQAAIEPEFRLELRKRHQIEFNHLYVITNMPINRFLEFLLRTEQYEQYMERLISAYNPAAAEQVMCRTTLSVGWDGRLYDCDFNQQLEVPLAPGLPQHVNDFKADRLTGRPIQTALHCYGCTAGAGSSCSGEVAR